MAIGGRRAGGELDRLRGRRDHRRRIRQDRRRGALLRLAAGAAPRLDAIVAAIGAGGAPVGDGTLDGLVSAIVVQNEQIGPTRYIATLGVTFDRARAGALLGVATYVARSQPMLVIPARGVRRCRAGVRDAHGLAGGLARYRTGASAIDYVRPAAPAPIR